MTIEALVGRHAGEIATIVGRGPSILRLVSSDIPPGPVITLNGAIRTIRSLHLPNPIYTMQKDGCVAHDGRWGDPPHSPCVGECGVTAKHDMVAPVPPETLIVSTRESAHCFDWYANRVVVDVESDLNLPWLTMSAPCAVRIAALMGAASLHMVGHDAYTSGDTSRVEPWAIVDDGAVRGYLFGGTESARLAAEAGLPVRWVA